MSTQLRRHFTTALRGGMWAFVMGVTTGAWAQSGLETSAPLDCTQFHVQEVSMLHLRGGQPWWFVSNDLDTKADFMGQTLPIMRADERFVWGHGSRVLTQVEGHFMKSLSANSTSFLIVHAKKATIGSYRPALGMYVETVGTASFDEESEGIAFKDGVSTLPLVIRSATREVMPDDRLLPVACFEKSMGAGFANEVKPEEAAEQESNLLATISVLLDGGFSIAEQHTLALIDHGRLQGVQVGQTWQLVDVLPDQPASAKSFGQAHVLEVFDKSSLVKIERATHEISVGTLLKQRLPSSPINP